MFESKFKFSSRKDIKESIVEFIHNSLLTNLLDYINYYQNPVRNPELN